MKQLRPGTRVQYKQETSTIAYHVRAGREHPGYVVLENGDWLWDEYLQVLEELPLKRKK